MAAYPVTFDVSKPSKVDRVQVALAILVYFIASFVLWLVYFIPVLSAVYISQKGPQRFLQEDGPRLTRWLHWLLALYAYLYLTSSQFPSENPGEQVRFEVRAGGTPTVGSALLRLIFSIPSWIVLSILGFVSFIIWIVMAIMVLAQETYSDDLFNFQRGVLRWQARLLAYHASLVDPYPPFALDTGPETAASP